MSLLNLPLRDSRRVESSRQPRSQGLSPLPPLSLRKETSLSSAARTIMTSSCFTVIKKVYFLWPDCLIVRYFAVAYIKSQIFGPAKIAFNKLSLKF